MRKHYGAQAEGPEKWAAYMRNWNANNKASLRRIKLKCRYGITIEDYNALLLKQGGHCALCNRTPEQERHGCLHVDHCHSTNKVRGLLCEKDNQALGKLGDTVDAIKQVLKYLDGSMT